MATQITTLPTNEDNQFTLMQREAALFASSPLIPQHLRGGGERQAMANCYIALKLARTMGEDPLVVLQNIHVVNGKAGFATQYMIARANAAGIFHGRIDWRIDRSDAENLSVTAFATLKDTGQEVAVTCDMAMARAEGWTKNPKYKSMPEVMLRYRSAAFLVRFYAPDVMLGYQTSEEVEDVALAAGSSLTARPLTAAMLTQQATGDHDAEPVDTPVDTLTDDNPTAQEGRSDEDMGEGFNDEAPAWRAAVDQHLEAVAAAGTVIDLKGAINRFEQTRRALPDEAIAEVDAAEKYAADRLNPLRGG